MSLHKYVANAWEFAEDLKDAALAAEYDDLWDDLPQYAFRAWDAFREKHQATIYRIVSATPAQRQKILAKKDRKTQFWLLLAAAGTATKAFALLHSAASLQDVVGLGYRQALGHACEALERFEEEADDWPFYSRCPYPFGIQGLDAP